MWNFILLIIINIILYIFGYLFIKQRIEKKLINKEILKNIKEQVNSMIIQLNETTVNNISLIEDKIRELDKKIILADKKNFKLKNEDKKENKIEEKTGSNISLFDNYNDTQSEESNENLNNKVYTPKKIVNQNKKVTEKLNSINERNRLIDEQLSNLNTLDKIKFLIESGYTIKDIQKKLNISSGELELLINIEKMNNNNFNL